MFLSTVSTLFSKVVTSDSSLVFRTKLLVSTALSFVISKLYVVFNLFTSNLSTSLFKAAKLVLLASLLAST